MISKTLLIFTFLLVEYYQLVNGWCSDNEECKTCTTSKSWFGKSSCRWCPVDEKCREKASIFNKCSITQNIKDSRKCGQKIPKYEPQKAYKMMRLSGVAYSNNAQKFLTKAFGSSESFQNVTQVFKACPGKAFCSGFTAVLHTSKAVVVAFRGSENFKQVTKGILVTLSSATMKLSPGGKVQAYFKNAFDLVWPELKPKMYQLIERYPNYKIWVTGHSLGAALASIASTIIAFERKADRHRIELYTFGQPRVGDYSYAKKHDELVKASWRVVHRLDIVVHMPSCKEVFKGTGCIGLGFFPYHHGTEIFYKEEVMTIDSTYKTCLGLPHNEDLRCSNDIFNWAQCLTKIFGDCITDHKIYFGQSIGGWWRTA